MGLFAKIIAWPYQPLGRVHLLSAAIFLLWKHDDQEPIFNILWMLVFGFATLNILGMAARRFDSNRRRLNFGELMAILIVLVAVVLLGWELLNLFHIFPIRIQL